MTTTLGKLISKSVPRYTSYPTAPHFSPNVTGHVYTSWLKELDPQKPLSLYLHVPFCQKMCWYCGCHTKIVARYDPVRKYAMALRAELKMLADALPGKFKVSHIHWGGGTPTMLSAEDFLETMDLIRDLFLITEGAELAVEIDPRTVDKQKTEALAASGINRASFGIQDFNPKVQAAINRIQSYDLTKEVTENFRNAGIENINFDLMYGLPQQTVDDVLNTVDLSHRLRPARIALFGYAHVPWMKNHMKMIRDEELPDSDARLEQTVAASDRLLELGYHQIGLDHFAKTDDTMAIALTEGTLNRNFQGYTTDNADVLLGVGASSIGRLPQGYLQNVVAMKTYEDEVLKGHFPIAKGVRVSDDDRLRGYVIERLMCNLEVDLDAAVRKFGVDISYFSDEINNLRHFANEGIISINGSQIIIQPAGRLLVRAVCAIFDIYFNQGLARHSKAV
ncbi:oxygen-independent coproporphyrinogen III oxidase [Sneathiella sp. HT1-7]|jgi:oxygen-independent coproporphyrinogen-3 oxidase|uniref:oxygen-independent coproporphyrinogen III oxidase n=1 Tax=Sneathiella sp. HT1-7 TaxID=2887192 RepID=UPI001D1544DA|nr:oxygen-independent coproporphyrinogen III oxidase [Sneathiella sp. HT1-7]MCC3306634.1 oxygen-independent coproporphyrinogen III oxidase [Sneathiella sp. HT1-7]